ncbi:glucan endo-1,3-beta-glucosidase-like isoform X1 [Ananas comosus]|uniref:Glucan endo-1,3-beta-glucosidase-like isoform X1 n=1 Tax=Ananas comosus TaxID=4615 RepID=A0A6P5ERR5_ANACO|nr:glucan endo-1,3-beta-glucosidase-like isoform X1 [Ananas comosus]
MFAAALLLLGVLVAIPTTVQSIGVCYGMLGNNLPPPSSVVNLYKSKGIGAMRIYSPDGATLQALKGSNIQLIVDVPNNNLQSIASDQSAAANWVKSNVQAYIPGVSFKYIAVGNEVIPGNQAQYVLPAMKNIYNALSSAGLSGQIKVSTAVSQGVLGSSYPPSNGAFSSDAASTLGPIVQFLAKTGAPLLVNVYPYFSYVNNQGSIKIDYALFTSPGTVVQDGQYGYQNLFDAIVDALYAALQKAGGSNVNVVVSESGWPSAGGTAATVSNAQTYNQNLIKHVGKGTPRKPGPIETYIFAMFNEDQKPAGIEQHWGLFKPDGQPVYPIDFS